jgi:nucleotide-binding universal stress UspA family protein
VRSPAHPVVVGVDGSARSVEALRWAGAEAAARGCPLVAVLACGDLPLTAPYAPVAARGAPKPPADRLAELVGVAFGGVPPIPVDEVCDPRRPVPALLAHGTGATLLVLATSPEPPPAHPSSGRNTGGSTALALVKHAPCPVVLLPVSRHQAAQTAGPPALASA